MARVACDALEIGKGPVQAGQKSKELFRRKDKGISVSKEDAPYFIAGIVGGHGNLPVHSLVRID